MGVEAIIAFGGNLGDVKKTLLSARRMLADNDNITLLACSRLYQSPPMGPTDQPDYFNAVTAIETRLSALPLLHLMQDIEARHGRTRNRRWGERSLDLDLIAYDDVHMQSSELTLPHPGMSKRMFVLQPLCDIRPDWRHPGQHPAGSTAQQLLQRLQASGTDLLTQGEAW